MLLLDCKFHSSNDFLRFHGDFFGVRGLFLCSGELHSPSFFSLGDVTNRLANQLLSSIVKTWNRVYKIRAAWMDRTRSWFFTPSNWSQYTLCSQMCFMKQTLLLYNFPEMTKKYVLFLWYKQIYIKCIFSLYQDNILKTRCVRTNCMSPPWTLRRLANVSPFFNSLSNRLRITKEFQSWSVTYRLYSNTLSYQKSSQYLKS